MFNFIAASMMGYIISRILKPAGVNSDESAPHRCQSPACRSCSEWFSDCSRNSPVNITFFLAIAGAGRRLLADLAHQIRLRHRALGHNPTAARYAGMSNAKLIMIVMAICGRAGRHGGGQRCRRRAGPPDPRLSSPAPASWASPWPSWARRTRSASALSALLFGVLYQGGQELAFTDARASRAR